MLALSIYDNANFKQAVTSKFLGKNKFSRNNNGNGSPNLTKPSNSLFKPEPVNNQPLTSTAYSENLGSKKVHKASKPFNLIGSSKFNQSSKTNDQSTNPSKLHSHMASKPNVIEPSQGSKRANTTHGEISMTEPSRIEEIQERDAKQETTY